MRRVPEAKPQKQQIPSPPSRRCALAGTLSSPTKLSNESSMAQGVEVSFDSLFRDETSGANIVHSGSLGLVFAQGVSSFLTLNQFKLEYCFRFR
jgi:hypothetical protein